MKLTSLERDVLAELAAGRDAYRLYGGGRRVSQTIARLRRKGAIEAGFVANGRNVVSVAGHHALVPHAHAGGPDPHCTKCIELDLVDPDCGS